MNDPILFAAQTVIFLGLVLVAVNQVRLFRIQRQLMENEKRIFDQLGRRP